MAENIIIKGARQHNLKNIDLTIPRDKMIVVTGLSGSGKSSLAFDTIYAEGQRRYVESLSAYARQFLGQMDKPDVDYIEGLSPAISIDQKNSARNPRSTVGTVTEIYDYLRLLFARIGHPHCYRCGRPITRQTVTQMVDSLMELPPGTRIQVLAPVIRGRKGEHQKVLAGIRKDGYIRVRVDGEVYSLDEDIPLEKNKKHTIEVVVDRIIIKEDVSSRLAESLETALSLGEGTVTVDVIGDSEMVFSENLACVYCGISIEELTPRMFSFNAPYGACPVCSGLGSTMEIDPDYVVPDKNKSLNEGAIAPWSKGHNGYYQQTLTTVAAHYGFSMDTPFRMLKPEHQDIVLYGNKGEKIEFTFVNRFNDLRRYQSDFEGVIPNLERRYRETESDFIKADLERYMSTKPCAECNGARLKPEILSVFVGGKNIHEVTCMTVSESVEFFNSLDLTPRETKLPVRYLRRFDSGLAFMPGGFRLPYPGTGCRHIVRRGVPADPFGNPDRFRAGWVLIYWMSPASACTREQGS